MMNKKYYRQRAKRPRLTVFRSNKYIYAQIIDDGKSQTLVAAGEKDLVTDRKKGTLKTQRARLVGKILAERALKKGIKQVRFDRRSYKYHGRVKALAEGARQRGLKF
jgi:large subunit ribosomal protein L18